MKRAVSASMAARIGRPLAERTKSPDDGPSIVMSAVRSSQVTSVGSTRASAASVSQNDAPSVSHGDCV